jgi:hypothetical protein
VEPLRVLTEAVGVPPFARCNTRNASARASTGFDSPGGRA